MINIDHHHDLGYAPPDKEEENLPNCSNWCLYLLQEDLINSYTWYNNSNSDLPKEEYINNIQIYNFESFQPELIPIPDELIICISEPWVPPYIRPLFYSLIDITNNYYNTHFDIIYGAYPPIKNIKIDNK